MAFRRTPGRFERLADLVRLPDDAQQRNGSAFRRRRGRGFRRIYLPLSAAYVRISPSVGPYALAAQCCVRSAGTALAGISEVAEADEAQDDLREPRRE